MDRNEEIKRKRYELNEKLKKTEEELKNLRKSCKHSEIKVKDINFGHGRLELRKICEFCEKVIGFPSKDDLKKNGYSS